jgi:hypothetical protein
MKTFKQLFTAFVFMSLTGSLFANPVETKLPEYQQIQKLVSTIDFSTLIDKETLIQVDFMINSSNEIVVIGTNDANLDNVIKSSLNYKKLDVSLLKKNEVYTLPIRIK